MKTLRVTQMVWWCAIFWCRQFTEANAIDSVSGEEATVGRWDRLHMKKSIYFVTIHAWYERMNE